MNQYLTSIKFCRKIAPEVDSSNRPQVRVARQGQPAAVERLRSREPRVRNCRPADRSRQRCVRGVRAGRGGRHIEIERE
jgi:hypothetical protein